jgi:phenylpyruvate tautomerase PptA (4-oxalocrotonate tautomerase family)
MPNITVQWYAGRTDQQKREITAVITDAMVKIGKTTADQCTSSSRTSRRRTGA